MERDRGYDRGYDRQDVGRRGRTDDDARMQSRERYGNEEDPYSREARRIYRDQDLERRMHDDRPYNRPGYEPEVGRPGGRENVDLSSERPRLSARGQGGDEYGYDWERAAGASSGQRQGDQRRSPQTGGYDSGRPASPYDQGDVGSWYGGDTGMGDSGSSLDRPRYQDQPQRGQQHQTRPGEQRGFGQGGYGQGGTGQSGFGQSGFGQGSYGQGGQQSWGQSQHQSSSGSHDPAQEGPFTGRGPRGYRRSDERIREDVCELLTRHGEIDASSMEVDVRQGTVILRGMADSGRTRRLTEELVEGVAGVNDVENQLRVNQRTGYTDTSNEMQGEPRGTPRVSGVSAYGTGVAETSGVSTRGGPGEPGMSAGAGASQHGNRWQIRETMDVVGSDGETVGTVKSVRGTDFEVNRPMSRDLYVPFSAVRTVDSERVLLSCRAGEVDQQNWPTASLTGASDTPPSRA